MKLSSPLALALAAFLALPVAQGSRVLKVNGVASSSRGTVGRIVKLLKDMIKDSEDEGEKDRELWAKYKCYCDDNTKEKSEDIRKLTKQIGLLKYDIEKLMGGNGRLSSEAAKLKKDMDENEEARNEAETMHTKAMADADAEAADLETAIEQIGKAIEELAAVGADQTLLASAEHEEYMANFKPKEALIKVQAAVSQALVAANSMLKPGQLKKAEALLQAPFGGAYTTQSAEIVGILKDMKETFQTNLDENKSNKKKAEDAHEEFMDTKKKEHDTMKEEFDDKQNGLGSGDSTLSGKKDSLDQAEEQKTDAESFLETLEPMCKEKALEYEERKTFRAKEQAGLSEAIAILDNDLAFETFGKVKATSGEGLFVQLSSKHKRSSPKATNRKAAAHLLSVAARTTQSSKLAKVAVMLTSGNPFEKVFEEIDNMKEVIEKEGEADKAQKEWCETETTDNEKTVEDKGKEITDLEGDIETLETDIDDPAKGLKVMIEQTETDLADNSKSQEDETKTRREDNIFYQEQARNSADATRMLKKAITVLKRHFEGDQAAEIQTSSKSVKKETAKKGKKAPEEPAPPDAWEEGEYTGQSTAATTVIGELETVQENTEKEEEALHTDEQKAQTDFEESIDKLKTEEEDLQKNLVKFKADLADAKLELEGKREELDRVERQKRSVEKYLESISPSCEKITSKFDDRKAAREKEITALGEAKDLLKASPAYVKAESAAALAAQGDCGEACTLNADHVSCKACLAKVSIPGYCAGHETTPGC